MIVVDIGTTGKISEGEHNVIIRVGPGVGAHLTVCALMGRVYRWAGEHDSGMRVNSICASIVTGSPGDLRTTRPLRGHLIQLQALFATVLDYVLQGLATLRT